MLELPNDVILKIFPLLDILDILSLRLVILSMQLEFKSEDT